MRLNHFIVFQVNELKTFLSEWRNENRVAERARQKVKGKSVENNEGDDQSMGVAF